MVRAEALLEAGGDLPAAVRSFSSGERGAEGIGAATPPPVPPPADPAARRQLGARHALNRSVATR